MKIPETIGVDIARQCKWVGEDIMSAFLEALTDANYHALRLRIEETYNNYLEEVL